MQNFKSNVVISSFLHQKLSLEDSWKSHKFKIFSFAAILIVDCTSCFVLYALVNNWDIQAWSPYNFAIKDLLDFKNNTTDLILIALLRVILVSLFTILAVRKGSKRTQISILKRAEDKRRKNAMSRARRKRNHNIMHKRILDFMTKMLNFWMIQKKE